jgi:hypothetical protein
MITQTIQQELRNQDYKIIHNEPYEVKNNFPLYNYLINLVPKKDFNLIYEFPIEMKKRIIRILKLPFNLGRLIFETIK